MFIGASMGASDIASYKGALAGNNIMRIFPVDQTVSGKALKVLPGWTDSRLLYCKDNNVIPFVSTKVDGNDAGITYVMDQLKQMPSWVTTLYVTDRHEPEADMTADTFKANFREFWTAINGLPTATRAKIKCGPVLTRTWTEQASKGNFNYRTYDPGVGDFFGVDMYVQSSVGSPATAVSPSTLVTPTAFTQYVKAYKYDNADTRARWFPELGLIGMPADTTGNSRATWLQGVHNEVKTWRQGQTGWAQPWDFAGWIWWHQEGKATGTVAGIGDRRDFPLHRRTAGSGTTADPYRGVDLPGSPPPPLATYNSIWTTENGGGGSSTQTVTVGTVTGVDAPQPVIGQGGGTSTSLYMVGATMKKADLPAYEAMLAANSLMRVFPNSDGLPPAWDDPRFVYCKAHNTVPFVSSNIDGDASKFPAMRQWILNMPAWVTTLYVTDRHEPENNMTAAVYKANFTAWWNNVIVTLPAETRARVRAGHVLTRQFIENPTKGADNYAQYDTGLGGFYGVDFYMDSWKPGGGTNATMVAEVYPNPVTFLAKFKAYRLNSSDTRDRIFPEIGAIGIPTDTDGTLRAAFITGVHAELDSWTAAAQGWKFVGAAWWNNEGTGGSSLTPIGTKRYFYLDKRQGAAGALVTLPGNPPAPVAAYNRVALTHTGTGGGDGGTDDGGGGGTDDGGGNGGGGGESGGGDDGGYETGGNSGYPVDTPDAARLMAAEYTLLVTDKNLLVHGDPIAVWTALDVTLRFNEVSSGQFTCPGYPWVRDQFVPGARVVCIRRVLDTATVLMAGPVESTLYERSDDGDNSGDGTLTVTWADDLAWVAGRVAYPDPTKTPETQAVNAWTWNGNAETGMRNLVDANAGPSALSARRVPRLSVAPAAGIGADVQLTDIRWVPVTDVLRTMARRGGGLGFRTRQTMAAREIVFEVFKPRNLSRLVRFGFGLGNLKDVAYEVTAPEVNAALVGGQIGDVSEGANRFVLDRSDLASQSAWGRLETLVSRPGNDPTAELQAAGDEALTDGGEGGKLSSNAADTVDQRYGVHYDIGDLVSIEVWPGTAVTDVVKTVHVQAWPTAGELVGITIGAQAVSYDSAVSKRLREIDRRVGVVERLV